MSSFNRRKSGKRTPSRQPAAAQRKPGPDAEAASGADDESGAPPVTGTLTALQPQVRNSDRYSLQLDEQFAFGIHSDVLLAHDLRIGMLIDAELSERLRGEDAVIRAKQRAMGLLAHRPRTESELRTRLGAAGFEGSEVDAAMTRLAELGHIDDRAFAAEFIRGRMTSRGYGARRILGDLRRRGVEAALAEEVLSEVTRDRDPLADARALAERYLPRLEREPDLAKRHNRLYGYLLRRGFEATVVQSVVTELLERAP